MSTWKQATVVLLDGRMYDIPNEYRTNQIISELISSKVIVMTLQAENLEGLGRCKGTVTIPVTAIARVVEYRDA